jgi:TolB-like protein
LTGVYLSTRRDWRKTLKIFSKILPESVTIRFITNIFARARRKSPCKFLGKILEISEMAETTENKAVIYRFGKFEIDSGERLLRSNGEIVPLSAKIFETLLYLVKNNGRLLLKDELMENIWTDSFVEETNLTANVSVLRKILHAEGERFIETFPKRGYRFRGDVEEIGGALEIVRTRRVTARVRQIVEEDSTDLLEQNRTKSLAVLPFLTLGLKAEYKYLGLGLADALITRLSQMRELTVRPTSAVQSYSDGRQNSIAVGRELRVGAIMEGTLRQAGKQLRVTVRLLDVESENALWATKFDIELADIFAAEDEITTHVADALFLNLSGEERRRIENRGTNNAEAYQAYLQGRYFWNKFIPEDLPKAIEAFETAIALDPNFAQAYAGIARAYRYILGLQSIVASQEAKEKMLRAATGALALNDALAEAHLAIAEIKKDEWDWAFAEREYKRAIALNPNLADARAGYADFLGIFERFDEAFQQIEYALELDPLSSRLKNGKGKILMMARRYEEAVELFKTSIKIEPNDALAHYCLGYSFACRKMFAEAIAEYQKAIAISDASPDEFLGYAYAQAGHAEAALEILEKVKNKKDVSLAELAVIYVGLGNKEAAFDALEKAFEKHDLQMQYLKVEQHYDAIRADARFQELLKRLGF